MAKTYLTDAAVERYRRPQTGRTEISDSEPGLFLWITPSGTKSWVVIYRLASSDGNRTLRRKTVIGRWPKIDVTHARDEARRIMEMAASGIDPELAEAEERAAQQQAEAEARAGAFSIVGQEYVMAMKDGKLVGGRKRPVAATTAANRESLLNRLVIPAFGDRPLAEVTPQRVAQLLAKIDADEGPTDETLKVIRGTFKFAVSRGLFHGPLPTSGMTGRQPPKKETRALADEELARIWEAAGSLGLYGIVVRLLMLTGQRRTEIAALRWNEVDWERRLLIIPANRVKNRLGCHEVPLTERAIELLKQAQAIGAALGNESGLAFPSDTLKTPITGWNKLKNALDRAVKADVVGLTQMERRAIRAGGALRSETKAMKAAALAKLAPVNIAPWRLHDLRHSVVTRLRSGEENAEGELIWAVPLEVVQATVNHQIGGEGVTARYDHGDLQRRYRLQKREALAWWTSKLLTIVGETEPEDNVVPLRAGAVG